MPTWCDSDLTLVSEESGDIKQFVEYNRSKTPDKVLDAESFVPIPSDPNIDLKVWDVANWGARSNLDEVKETYPFGEKNKRHQYSFRTIGTPPKPVIKAMSEMFPSIIFILEYYEKVAGFRGMVKFREGVLIHEESGEYYGRRGGIG